MAFIPVPDTALVELVFNWDGQIVENTLYFRTEDVWTENNLIDLSDRVSDWWLDKMRPQQVATVSLVMVRARDLTTQFSPGIENVNGLPLAGTFASPSLPNNVSIAVSFRTNLRGRSYRGRNYFVGLGESHIDNNLLTVPAQAALLAIYGDLMSYMPPTDYQHVVVSRYQNNAPRAIGVTTPVTAYTVDRTVDSQRRRLPGRGA